MNYYVIKDLFILFGLGCLGWFIFSRLLFPVPALFGTIIFTSTLRLTGCSLPQVPDYLSPLIQVLLGIFIGSKITRSSIKDIKTMIIPAIIIVVWALAIVFLLGHILSHYTYLDPMTAIISSSIGGLPEMTVIALDTGANIADVIIMHVFRIVTTMIAFPFILKLWMRKENQKKRNQNSSAVNNKKANIRKSLDENNVANDFIGQCRYIKNKALTKIDILSLFNFIKNCLLTIAVAAIGGLLFSFLGVPAGGMVGAMFFIAIFSFLRIMPIISPSVTVFGFIQIGLGLMVSENINTETIEVIMTGKIIIPMLISTILIFLSSLIVASMIHYISGWDFPTCFLAAAPSGFTVMTILAVKYDKDPFRVSMLHLCRLVAIKSVLPFIFMVYF